MEYCQLYAYYKPVHLVIYKTSWLAMALFFLSLSLGEGIENKQRVGYKPYTIASHEEF